MITTRHTAIPGCMELQLPRFEDDRGSLTKGFHLGTFESLGLPVRFAEQFHSRSRRGVIRGMHFQRPPQDFYKVVTCVTGKAWDVVLDLRSGSPSFGEYTVITLSDVRSNAVVVPSGCAHGFLALEEGTILSYLVTAEHDHEHDDGIHWDSAGIPWPLDVVPIVSPRDASLTKFADFETPFISRT